MKQYFGEFLVEEGHISEEELLTALLEQAEALPSSARILLESQALSSKSILSALKAQHEQKIDFRSACLALDLWQEDFEQIIDTELSKKRRPIGSYILDQTNMTAEDIRNALEEYFSKNPRGALGDEDSSRSNVIPLTSKSSQSVDKELLEAHFNQVHFNKMSSLLNAYSVSPDLNIAELELALWSLKGLFTLCHFSAGLKVVEDMIGEALKGQEMGELIPSLQTQFMVLWSLRDEAIFSSTSEEEPRREHA